MGKLRNSFTLEKCNALCESYKIYAKAVGNVVDTVFYDIKYERNKGHRDDTMILSKYFVEDIEEDVNGLRLGLRVKHLINNNGALSNGSVGYFSVVINPFEPSPYSTLSKMRGGDIIADSEELIRRLDSVGFYDRILSEEDEDRINQFILFD